MARKPKLKDQLIYLPLTTFAGFAASTALSWYVASGQPGYLGASAVLGGWTLWYMSNLFGRVPVPAVNFSRNTPAFNFELVKNNVRFGFDDEFVFTGLWLGEAMVTEYKLLKMVKIHHYRLDRAKNKTGYSRERTGRILTVNQVLSKAYYLTECTPPRFSAEEFDHCLVILQHTKMLMVPPRQGRAGQIRDDMQPVEIITKAKERWRRWNTPPPAARKWSLSSILTTSRGSPKFAEVGGRLVKLR